MAYTYVYRNKLRLLGISTSGYPMSGSAEKFLFSALGKYHQVIDVFYPRLHGLNRYVNAFRSFHPNRNKWDVLFDKNAWAFQKKTELCEQKIKSLKNEIDLVFGIGCLSAFSVDQPLKPYVLYIDSTMRMSEREYPPWSQFRTYKERCDMLKLEQKAYSKAVKIFTFSEYTRRVFIRDYGIHGRKVVNVHWGGNIHEIPSYEKDYSSKTILFVGKNFERKGGFTVLRAFKEIRKKVKDAKLIIVGSTPKVTEEGVIVRGFIDYEEKLKLFREASLFVMPSIYEPSGHIFAEVMAYKIPCIGSTRNAMPEIIDDGKNGFIISPNDHDTLASRIIYLLTKPEIMKSMGQNAQRKIQKSFTWEKVAQKISENLKSI